MSGITATYDPRFDRNRIMTTLNPCQRELCYWLNRQLEGEPNDRGADFAVPLRQGVDAFRLFVESRYDARLQQIHYAGHARDQSSSCVRNDTPVELCRAQ